ncbi:MAG: class I SAM-dependent rRNA methyltransferase [Nitrospiraceae bacterium]|nr:class I SAM-dependent rRNA methyltransferase [Nitrospiraceae bacterium]
MERVKLRKTARLLGGHRWVFSNELAKSPRGFAPGQLVELHDHGENFLGIGYINPDSLISVRVLTRIREPIDLAFFRKRIEAAMRFRERFLKNEQAVRLVYSEADGLPGLIADRYGDVVVLQLLTAGMEAMKDLVLDAIDALVRPRAIVLKNDSRSRALEGLPAYKEVARGALDPLPVIGEDGVLFEIDPLGGQKTGFFLDQRENRLSFKGMLSGEPDGVGLDLFGYAGGWGLHLAHAGARKVVLVDESEGALARARKNAGLNGLEDKMEFVRADVFDFLEGEIRQGNARYDFIVMDPPAFVKSAKKIKEAVRAYTLLNSRCMRLLKPGGLLATSSCSYHLARPEFLDMLRAAAKSAGGRDFLLVEQRFQGRDHPVLLSMPESEYLKCAFLLAQ